MAAKAARSTIDSIQNRAKASVFKAANLGYQMAQKALDKVGEQLGKKESELLKFADITSAIIKTCDHFQSDRIQEGNYTFAKTQDGVSVVSNDGKEIYKADSQGAKFTGGVKDYDMLAKVKAAIEAVANPAAIAVEILKNEALKTVQQEGQKSAVKL
jgi:hypothetical protein